LNKSLLLILILFAQISHADIDCSAINSNCVNSANSATEQPVEKILADMNNIANSTCIHPQTKKKHDKKNGVKNDHYKSEVNKYCGCIKQNVVQTIKKEKLNCDSFNSYLSKAKENMVNNTWRFAGAGWKSSFHSNITVINTLNSAFQSNYDNCSVNKLVKDKNGLGLLFKDLHSQFKELKVNKNTPQRTIDLKKCVEDFTRRHERNDPTLKLEINNKMMRNFGVDAEEFSKSIIDEYNVLTGAKSDPGACTTPAEQTVLKSIPTWDQLEFLSSQKTKITSEFIDDLYRRRMSYNSLSPKELSLLKLFDNEPRLKMLFSKQGVNTEAQKAKLFISINEVLKNKDTKKGKYGNINVFEEIFQDPYYKSIVQHTCDELSNDFAALMCANDEDFPLSDRDVITSIPDNYNLLGDEGAHLDKELSKVAKVCSPESVEYGCQTRSLPFETVYCDSVKDDELSEDAENGAIEKFLDSESLVSNSRNSIFTEYIYDDKIDVQQFQSLQSAFENKKNVMFGSEIMCNEMNNECAKYNKTSFEYVNCRFNYMAKYSDSTLDPNTSIQLKQYSQFVNYCMNNATKNKFDELCSEKLLMLGLKMSNGAFKVQTIESGEVTITYGADNSIERVSEFDPTVPHENIKKQTLDFVHDNNVEIEKDDNIRFSGDSSSKVQKNIQDTLNNLKNNDLNFTQQYTTLKNVQPAVIQQIKESEQEVVKEKENIANIDQKIRRSKTSQERELLELERALMEKNLKEKEKSLAAIKGQADRLSQLVQDLERKISEEGSLKGIQSKVAGKGFGQQLSDGNEGYNQQNNFHSKRGHDFQKQNVNNSGSNQSSTGQANFVAGGRGASGFREQSNDGYRANDSYLQSEQDKIDRDGGSLKLNAVPMSLTDLSQIESVEKLQEVLNTYGLTDGPFYLYDKKSDLLTKVIGYKVVDNHIVYEVLKDGQVQVVQANNLKSVNTRMPASVEPIKVETPQQVRKYSLEILSNILKNQ
jgi:hypothetical protein